MPVTAARPRRNFTVFRFLSEFGTKPSPGGGESQKARDFSRPVEVDPGCGDTPGFV